MRFLPLLGLVMIPLPSQALTWNDLLNSYTNRTPYNYERRIYDRGRYVALCNVRVLREEYVPADGNNPGYLKTWEEYTKIPCDVLNNKQLPYVYGRNQ